MKNNKLKLSRVLGTFVLAGAFIISACDKDDDNPTVSASDEEAAEVMMESVNPATGGLVLDVQASAQVAVVASLPVFCGVERDSSITRSYESNSRSFSSSLSWSSMLNCENNMPSSYHFAYSGTSSYDGPRLNGTDEISGDINATGLALNSAEIMLNGTVERSGTKESEIREERSFSSSLSGTLKDVRVNKITKKITGGMIDMSVEFMDSEGNNVTKTGTITFNGSESATVELTSGSTYNFKW